MSAEHLRTFTQRLSADELQGRGTGSAGGRKATELIANAMKAAGLRPAGERGTFFASVPLQGHTVHSATVLTRKDRDQVALQWSEAIVATSWVQEDTVRIDAPLVFAGYGITAPEHGWDDYGEVDVRDRAVVVLTGVPPTEKAFAGSTEHGRWTSKIQRARDLGAAACLIVHAPAAGYDWEVVRTSFGGEQFTGAKGSSPLSLEGWIHESAARAIAEQAGESLAAWRREASQPEFRAHPLSSNLEGSLSLRRRAVVERNVVGALGDQDARAVVLAAHWDHLGMAAEPQVSDGVFNGAIDNASGVAALLALAHAASTRHKDSPVAGTLLFIATAAEEHGLWGARQFVRSPPVPRASIVAAINFDAMNPGPITESLELVDAGHSTLDDMFATAVASQQRRAVPDRWPEAGAAYRSDQRVFFEAGIPALYFQPSFVEDAAAVARGKARAERYHTVRDEFDPRWSFEGARADTQAAFDVVLQIMDDGVTPRVLDASALGR